jgi:CopG family nickel-responsive transcriptional regulator
MALERFGVSMDANLLEKFDSLVEERGYASRSEAVRDLVREELVRQEWEDEATEVVGTITMVYNHHVRGLSDVLLDEQHDHHEVIRSTMHIHLDKHNCLEVLVVCGTPQELRKLANKLISTRGVKHGELTMTSTGKDLE